MIRGSFVVLPVLLVGALAIGGYIWHLGNARIATMQTRTETVGVAAIGGPFSLIDQDGNRRTEADFAGRHMLIFFGFTHCPDVCPTSLSVIAAALDRLGPAAERIVPILITVDPARDTPEVLKAYTGAFGPRFVGLTGTEADVARAAEAYRVYYREAEDGGFDHSSVIYLMDGAGAFIANYSLGTPPDEMAADLRRRLAESD